MRCQLIDDKCVYSANTNVSRSRLCHKRIRAQDCEHFHKEQQKNYTQAVVKYTYEYRKPHFSESNQSRSKVT